MTEFMSQALLLAKKAGAEGEVPVGAVIVRDGEVIATGQNRRETQKNATRHAEIEAIEKACEVLGSWRLEDCELYVTLEPCPMCAGAIINARIPKVVYGATDIKGGACDSVVNLFNLPFNHKPDVWAGICEQECSELLQEFFKGKR
ncbi:MAG: nucleoside deaminase [Ruminococcaceae bacterium]|nr:nucleoside deaminase [Oscillospiraceae bacterium]